MKWYWVYMVRCADDSYYVGVTNDPDRRVAEHNLGIDPLCYTFKRRPVRIVFVEHFATPIEAIFVEKRLKGWSRAKKEALVRGDWAMIHALAQDRRPRPQSDAGDHPSRASG